MKILFVIDTLGSGGKERRLTELLKALVYCEEVTFELAVMSKDIHYTEIWGLGITIHQILRQTRRDLSVFKKFSRLIKQVNPDAVHCWDSMTAVYLAPVCKLAGYPLINGMVTNVPVRNRLFNYHWIRGRLTFPLSSVIVSNSREGLNAYCVPARKGYVIPNGFNFSRLDQIDSPGLLRSELGISTDYVVGMVASFGKQKDYPTYYKAAQLVLTTRRDVTFVAIGAETDSEESKGLVDKSVGPWFRFLGKRSGIESFINLLDVCILATFTEGISNSIMEYMALAKPVIATIGGGTGELVNSGETGFLIDPSDYVALAGKIDELLNNNDLRSEMGRRGKERIQSHFSIDLMVMNYISLYRQVCRTK